MCSGVYGDGVLVLGKVDLPAWLAKEDAIVYLSFWVFSPHSS